MPERMSNVPAEMIDAVFGVSGGTLPATYPYALWQALLRHAPALAGHTSVGVLPLRAAVSEDGMLLPRRAKLVLRLPAILTAHVDALSGQQLDLGETLLQLGKGTLRPLQPYPTLHAHLVGAHADEEQFMRDVSSALAKLEVAGKLICGMRNTLHTPERAIHGFSLVIHDLKPEASLRLQCAGLGADRNFGCGIFVPYKAITDLD